MPVETAEERQERNSRVRDKATRLIGAGKDAFINRWTVGVFDALDETALEQITKVKFIEPAAKGLLTKHGLALTTSGMVVNEFLKEPREASQGASALDHIVQQKLVKPLTKYVMAAKIHGTAVIPEDKQIEATFDREQRRVVLRAKHTREVLWPHTSHAGSRSHVEHARGRVGE